jgi:hypothetical protein
MKLLSGSVVTMVTRDAVEGVGDAEHSRLRLVRLGGEGAKARATCALRVFPEERLRCVLWRGYAGSLSGGAVSCNTCNAAIVERDIVCKPGVISSGEAEAALSTGRGTGRGVSGEWGRKTGFLIICLHTSWTTSRIRVLEPSGIRCIARFLIRLCK